MSQLAFLKVEWPELHEAAAKAEASAYPDPRTACFHARRALELLVSWLYKYDSKLKLPYQDNLSALLHEPTFKQTAGPAVFTKAVLINRLGNQAVHGHRPVPQYDALTAVQELFHVSYWLAHTYARGLKPSPGLVFDRNALPKSSLPKQTVEALQKLETELHEKDEKLSALLADKTALDAELTRLRAEVAEAKKANTAQPDAHDYSEAETRDFFIDLLLKEAGWPLHQKQDREYPVSGMPNEQGKGLVDYVLWGDDGKPLGLVEAKRTKKSPQIGQQQAKLYADCLEAQFGRRPVIFYSNGYEHWIWDDASYPPRQVQGFYKKAELDLIIQRRESRQSLAEAEINGEIVERYYQTRAIRRIGEAFERDQDRKALVVMATGAGKTRTVIALCDLLMRCNWAKRVLFLADRVALVNQAVNAFKKHLPDCSPVNLVTDKTAQGRVYVSTYPTMMRQIDESANGQRRFGAGHFDLVIVDEAHRSIYQKYGAIFDYFDSLLVGLTATPKDEVDFNTYGLFDLERGVPTDAYSLEDAVKDGYLVPLKAVSVPLKFQREGIKYDDLSEEEKEEWDAKEWSEDGTVPERIEADAVNKWLFNKDTVDKVLEHLMTRGQKMAGGDRLGKTIIFAKNQAHAEFIAQRFDANYPHYQGAFARVIHCNLTYAQSLIDAFANAAKAPHIAISVDMLDTGIDVPEVVNLVFFKLVRSKTKFWQMIGRGTRLAPELFGPARDKEFFYVFDYCQNLEFFSQDPETTEGSVGASLTKRLFTVRLELIAVIDKQLGEELVMREGSDTLEVLRQDTAKSLQGEVAAMNLDNFIVRPKRRLVEKYSAADAWTTLSNDSIAEIAREIAGLPSEIATDDEDAKRFDLLMLNLQLAQLRAEPSFARLRDQVKSIAGLLEEKANIPMVQLQLELIQQIQSDEWWQDVTIPLLEQARKRIRLLVKFIEKQARKPIFTDFEDTIGQETSFEMPGFSAPDSYERFRAKARHYLREHENHLTIHKLRTNEPLTRMDLTELERMLVESGVGSMEDVEKAKIESNGLGLFVRSLVGLERHAAKKALGAFLVGGNLRANQIQFLDEIVNYLTEHGCMSAARLYESPYTDFNPQGVDGVFTSAQVDDLLSVLDDVRMRAIA
jgi:type I restriction enzyme R subunit